MAGSPVPSRYSQIRPQRKKPSLLKIKDCALIPIATGKRAQNLRDFNLQLSSVPKECVFYHFWGGLLRPGSEDPEFSNDFASWARHGLHDYPLAERLAMIDPSEFSSLEKLRREVIEIAEARLDEREMVPWAKRENLFYFQKSQIIVFETGQKIKKPILLAEALQNLSVGSIFFHFIDARRRNEERYDDFSLWLESFGRRFDELVSKIRVIDPHFGSLTEMRDQLSEVFLRFFREHAHDRNA